MQPICPGREYNSSLSIFPFSGTTRSATQLEAIKQTKVNMTVWLADYNVPTNATAYSEQRDTILDAIKTYGTDHVGGVTVGNEFILEYVRSL